MSANFYLFFVGEKSYWAAKHYPIGKEISCTFVVLEFIEHLNNTYNLNLDYDVSQYSVLADIDDYRTCNDKQVYEVFFIPTRQAFDLLIRLKSTDVLNPNKIIPKPGLTKFVEVGQKLLKAGDISGAYYTFKIAEIYGLYDLALLVSDIKIHSTLTSFIHKLPLIFPNNPIIEKIIGEYYESQKNTQNAIAFYKSALKLSRDIKLLINLSVLYFSHGDISRALLYVEHALAQDGINSDALMQYAKIQTFLHEYDNAILACFKNKKCYFFLAYICKFPDAVDRVYKIIENMDLPPRSLSDIGKILFRNGAMSEGLYFVHKASQKDVQDLDLALRYFKYLFELNRKNQLNEAINKHMIQITNCNLPNHFFLIHEELFQTPKPDYIKLRRVQKADINLNIYLFNIIIYAFFDRNIHGFSKCSNLLKSYIKEIQPKKKLLRKFLACQAMLATAKDRRFLIEETPAFGDEIVMLISFINADFGDQMHKISPKFFKKISILDLARSNRSSIKKIFFDRIASVANTDGEFIILSLGTNDCHEAIPQMYQECQFPTVEATIDYVVNSYITILNKVYTLSGEKTVLLLPAFCKNSVIEPLVEHFNQKLSAKLPTFCVLIDENISREHYINQDEMIIEDIMEFRRNVTKAIKRKYTIFEDK